MGRMRRNAYDGDGNVTRSIDARGLASIMRYDAEAEKGTGYISIAFTARAC
jgi:hypothetical protein